MDLKGIVLAIKDSSQFLEQVRAKNKTLTLSDKPATNLQNYFLSQKN